MRPYRGKPKDCVDIFQFSRHVFEMCRFYKYVNSFVN